MIEFQLWLPKSVSDRYHDTMNHIEAPQVSLFSNIKKQERIFYQDILVRGMQNECQETGDQFHENRGACFLIEISDVQQSGVYRKIFAKVKDKLL